MRKIRIVLSFIFCLTVAVMVVLSKPERDPEISSELTRNLLNGSDRGFPTPGAELEPIRKILPQSGSISFITDRPFGEDLEISKFYHDAQNYLCPLILNPQPGETVGLAIFSTPEIAQKRLHEIRYSWAINWGDSKGIIRKNG